MLMKVIAGGAAAAAALALSTGTVAAAPGQTVNNGPISGSIPITCAGVGSGVTSFTGTGNSISHMSGNKNGGWSTDTQEGIATLTISSADGSSASYTGHVQDWNAGEFNRQTVVVHATVNFDGMNTADGSAFHLHANYDVTMTNVVYPPDPTAPPVGVTTASHADVSCS